MLRGRTTTALLASKEGVWQYQYSRPWLILSLPTPAQLLSSWLNISTIKKAQHQWIVNSSTSTSRRRIANTRGELNNTIVQQLSEKMSPEQLRANDLAKMKDALNWLTTLPLKSENFDLNKRVQP